MRTASVMVLAGTVVACGLTSVAAAQAAPAQQPPEQVVHGTKGAAPAPAPAGPADAAGKPTLSFGTTTHDFGIVSDDKPVTYKFEFTNTSDRVVTIKNVQTSCGCTTAPLTKRTFAPGESYGIDVTFNPQNRRGRELKTIHVDTDDAGFPRYDLQISVEIRPRVLIEPTIASLGMIKAGSAGSQIVTISGRSADFDIVEAKLRDDRLKLERVERTRATRDGDPMWQISYRVEVPAGLTMGAIRTFLDLSTNDPERKALSVAVNAEVIGDLAVMPDRVELRLSREGERWQREVRIEHRTQQAFEITGLDVDSPAGMNVVLDLMEEAKKDKPYVQRIRVSGDAPTAPGRVSGKLMVSTNVPGMEKIEIPLSGVYSPVGGAPQPSAPLILQPPAQRP